MGYASQHKSRTRARVVEAAARLFRRYGYNGVGIDDIMAAANLTRGGFYAHFKSKQDLFAAALEEDLALAHRLRDSDDAREGVSAARALIDFYLEPGNRADASRVCSLVSLSPDVARCGGAVSAAYTTAVRNLVAEIATDVAAPVDQATERALAALALCVGGVVLAHAIDDEHLAGALLEACRARAARELSAEPQ